MLNQLSHLFRRRILNTLKFSWDGLLSAWKSEEAIRIELLLLPLVIVGAYYLGSTKV